MLDSKGSNKEAETKELFRCLIETNLTVNRFADCQVQGSGIGESFRDPVSRVQPGQAAEQAGV